MIDADKLIELIDDDIASLDKNMSREGYDVCLCTLQMVKQYIKALPTVEAVPEEQYQRMVYTVASLTEKVGELMDAEPIKHGRWEQYLDEGLKWKCSRCGSRFTTPWNFCPNCGAKMEVER